MKWTKEVSDWEWWTITVPDYDVRLKALTKELQLKWHFREKKQRNEMVDAIYVLK